MNPSENLTLAHKINRLFEFKHRRGEPQRTTDAVAAEAARLSGVPISPAHLAALRSGEVGTAEPQVLAAICAIFGVDATYLTESNGVDVTIDQNLRLWILVRDRGMDYFAARAAGLSREQMEALIAEIEALPPAQP